MSPLFAILLLLLAALYFGRNLNALWIRFKRSVALLQDFPGLRLVVYPHSLFGLLPRLSWFNIGDQHALRYGHSLFADRGRSDVLSIVAFFPPSRALILADPVAIKFVTADRNKFIKPTHMYRALTQFGMNLAVAEGDVWRRHRRIVGGSFTDKTNELAWDETRYTMDKLLAEWRSSAGHVKTIASGKREIAVDSIVELTLKITLFVISAAAFSHRPTWNDDEPDEATDHLDASVPAGHSIPFRVALHGILDGAMERVLTPNWVYSLPLPLKRLRHVKTCYTECDAYLARFIAERKSADWDVRESKSGKRDLLGALCYASAAEESGSGSEAEGEAKVDGGVKTKRTRLTDEEVMGNMYVFLLAGHETTAHTLACTLALLALYPAEQDKVFAKIQVGLDSLNGEEPSYADYSKFAYVRATFLETLRLYPSVVVIPKYTTTDTLIPTASYDSVGPSGEVVTEGGENIFVPKWTEVLLDSVALHRNPKYWGTNANEFSPERFIDRPATDPKDEGYTWPRDAFIGFSAGHRSCPGRGFGTVEAVGVLLHILRTYSVHLAEDVDGSGARRAAQGESFEGKVARVMKCKSVITLTPDPRALVFRER